MNTELEPMPKLPPQVMVLADDMYDRVVPLGSMSSLFFKGSFKHDVFSDYGPLMGEGENVQDATNQLLNVDNMTRLKQMTLAGFLICCQVSASDPELRDNFLDLSGREISWPVDRGEMTAATMSMRTGGKTQAKHPVKKNLLEFMSFVWLAVWPRVESIEQHKMAVQGLKLYEHLL